MTATEEQVGGRRPDKLDQEFAEAEALIPDLRAKLAELIRAKVKPPENLQQAEPDEPRAFDAAIIGGHVCMLGDMNLEARIKGKGVKPTSFRLKSSGYPFEGRDLSRLFFTIEIATPDTDDVINIRPKMKTINHGLAEPWEWRPLGAQKIRDIMSLIETINSGGTNINLESHQQIVGGHSVWSLE